VSEKCKKKSSQKMAKKQIRTKETIFFHEQFFFPIELTHFHPKKKSEYPTKYAKKKRRKARERKNIYSKIRKHPHWPPFFFPRGRRMRSVYATATATATASASATADAQGLNATFHTATATCHTATATATAALWRWLGGSGCRRR
jgi:hypothetical protein